MIKQTSAEATALLEAFAKTYLEELDTATSYFLGRDYDTDKTSLTQQQTSTTQLRYYSKDRGYHIANALAFRLAPIIDNEVMIGYTDLSDLEVFFLSRLQYYSGCRMTYIRLDRASRAPLDYSEATFKSCMLRGDVWTAKQVGAYLVTTVSISSDLWLQYALCLEGHGDFFGTKAILEDLLTQDEQEIKPQVCYALAMLMIRHYPAQLVNSQQVSDWLNLAYGQLLQEVAEGQSTMLGAIFNRNGYALVTYRQGELEVTRSLMKRLLEEVAQLVGQDERMRLHQAVLTYNLFQVEDRLALEAAEVTLASLLDLDGLEEDYRFLALAYYLEHEKLEQAQQVAQTIKEEEVSNLAQYYSYQSFLAARMGRLGEARQSSQKAIETCIDKSLINRYCYNRLILGGLTESELELLTSYTNPLTADFEQVQLLIQQDLEALQDVAN